MRYWPAIICALAATACSPLPSEAINEALGKLHYRSGAWVGETKCVGALPAGVPESARCYAARNASTIPEKDEAAAIRAFWMKNSDGKWQLRLIIDESDKVLWRR